MQKSKININFDIEFTFETELYLEYQNLHRKIYTIEALYHNIESYINNYLKIDIDKTIDKEINANKSRIIDDEEADIIIQSIWSSQKITFDALEIYSQYMIVVMYSFFEKSLKSVLTIAKKYKRIKITKKEIDSIFKSSNLLILLKKLKLNNKLVKRSDVHRLKMLNNRIKHSIQPQENLRKEFIKLKKAPIKYLESFNSALIKYYG